MFLPDPRPLFTDPVPSLRWGIVGTGSIAGRFVQALRLHTTQQVVAVAARNTDRSELFATRHGIPRRPATPADLVDDPDIDVVYIATPHSSHRDLALLAIGGGKHVLVEKPLAASSAEAAEIATAAADAGVLVMEAMWTRYLPQFDILRQLLADGALGDVHQVNADFGSAVSYDPTGRLWNPDLAGGALLDIGVYPISLASALLGTPVRVLASGLRLANGVDLRSSAILTSVSGADANVACSIISELPTTATIVGSRARVEFSRPFYAPTDVTFFTRRHGRPTSQTWTDDTFTDRYGALSYEATALAGYVGQGRIESPLHPLAETVSVLTTIEEIRTQLSECEAPRPDPS